MAKKGMEVEEEVTLETGAVKRTFGRHISRPAVRGTVEFEAAALFEREKAAYEERTGETVNYVPPTPVTRTPIGEASQESGDESLEQEESAGDETAEGEG